MYYNVGSRLSGKVIEQQLSFFQVGGIELFGEASVDLGEHGSDSESQSDRVSKLQFAAVALGALRQQVNALRCSDCLLARSK